MSQRLTPGQKALREAARLETARVYGGVVPEHRQPVSVTAAVAEAEITARKPQRKKPRADPDIVDAIRRGMTNAQIIHAYAVDYPTVRAARKHAMGAA